MVDPLEVPNWLDQGAVEARGRVRCAKRELI